MNEVDLTDDASRGSRASTRRQRCRNVDVPVEADGLDRVAVNETTIQRESPCLVIPAVD